MFWVTLRESIALHPTSPVPWSSPMRTRIRLALINGAALTAVVLAAAAPWKWT